MQIALVDEIPFSCILLLGDNMISGAVSCKGALENFSKTTNCTRYLLRLVKYLVFDKITRFFVVFVVVVVVVVVVFFFEIVSVLICAVTYRLFRVI